MHTRREQLSLYVPPARAAQLEVVRRVLDPQQYSLIPVHVTLLRDDELSGLDEEHVERVLLRAPPFTLVFGEPEAFAGHGILLPCIAGQSAFVRLRELLVGRPRASGQAPHITLAHPRNPRSPGNSLSNAASLPHGIAITFPSVNRIRQEFGTPWSVLRTYALAGA